MTGIKRDSNTRFGEGKQFDWEDEMTIRIKDNAMDRHARRPRLLRTRQAADYLCVSSWSIRKWVAEGKLPVLQDGHGRFLLDVDDLDDYVDRAKVTRERAGQPVRMG